MSTKGRENWEKYKAGYVSTRMAEEVSTGNAGRDSWNELKKTIRFDKPESTQDVISGSGEKNDEKFNGEQYAKDARWLFLNGVAEWPASAGALIETWIGKGLDKLFPGAGFEGSGFFNAIYNGRPDWKWAAGYEFVKGKTGDLALSLLDKNAPPWRKVKVKWACFANP